MLVYSVLEKLRLRQTLRRDLARGRRFGDDSHRGHRWLEMHRVVAYPILGGGGGETDV